MLNQEAEIEDLSLKREYMSQVMKNKQEHRKFMYGVKTFRIFVGYTSHTVIVLGFFVN